MDLRLSSNKLILKTDGVATTFHPLGPAKCASFIADMIIPDTIGLLFGDRARRCLGD
jgi:hypothetical protein